MEHEISSGQGWLKTLKPTEILIRTEIVSYVSETTTWLRQVVPTLFWAKYTASRNPDFYTSFSAFWENLKEATNYIICCLHWLEMTLKCSCIILVSSIRMDDCKLTVIYNLLII